MLSIFQPKSVRNGNLYWLLRCRMWETTRCRCEWESTLVKTNTNTKTNTNGNPLCWRTVSTNSLLNPGSCVGGVVGSKMPHFSVFGDTVNIVHISSWQGQPFLGSFGKICFQVNIAALMESTSEPMKIQISQTTQVSCKYLKQKWMCQNWNQPGQT